MKRSRRQMLRLLAAGSAATLVGPAAALAETATRTRRRARRAPVTPSHEARASEAAPAIRAEVEKQKKDLATALKVIRDYSLPPGSEMAFVFRPMRVERRREP